MTTDPQIESSADTTDRPTRSLPWIIFVFALILFSIAGTRRDLWAPDEPRHAEVAAEMLRTGEYVVPHLNGEVYPDKPPPPFWVMTVALRVFGDRSEWAARLPFAFAAALTLALTFALARRLLDEKIALTAVLLLASAGRFAWLAQRVSLDIFQTLSVLVAIFAWVREHRREGSTWVNGMLFFGACGFGLSTKGPTALLVPLAAVIAHGLATGSLHRLGSKRFLVWALLMLGMVAAWLIPATMSAGDEYARAILGDRSFGRFTSASNHDQPFWYYFKEWPIEFLPWSPAFLAALWLAWKKELPCEPGARRLLLAWIVIPFIVLSIAATKRGNYLMPLYPAAAIIAATFLHAKDRNDSESSVVVHAMMRAITGLIALAGAAVAALPFTDVLEHKLPGLDIVAPFVGLAMVVVGVTAFRRGADSLITLHRTLSVGILALVPFAGLTVFPMIDAEKSDRLIAEKLLTLTNPADAKPIAFLRYSPEASRFYSRLDCVEIREREDLVLGLLDDQFDYAVIEFDKWEKLSEMLPIGTPVHSVGVRRGQDILIVDMSG